MFRAICFCPKDLTRSFFREIRKKPIGVLKEEEKNKIKIKEGKL